MRQPKYYGFHRHYWQTIRLDSGTLRNLLADTEGFEVVARLLGVDQCAHLVGHILLREA